MKQKNINEETPNPIIKYMHLYFGAYIKWKRPDDELYMIEQINAEQLRYAYSDMKIGLRDISELTNEEKIYIVEFIKYNHVKFSSSKEMLSLFDEEEYNKKVKKMRLSAEEFGFLLSVQIDLFGLIEKGIALNQKELLGLIGKIK